MCADAHRSSVRRDFANVGGQGDASLLEKVGTGVLSRLWGVSRGTLTKYSERGVETIKPESLQGYLQIMKDNLPGGELPADPSVLRDPRGRKKK